LRDRFVVAPGVTVPTSELTWRFTPTGGPGGQHANKSSTRVGVVFDLAGSPSLPDELRGQLVRRLGAEVSLVVDESRSQVRNRDLAIERLEARLANALAPRRPRRSTKPSKASVERRLDEKHRQSRRKAERRGPTDQE
jgi:ribosome-associated protein